MPKILEVSPGCDVTLDYTRAPILVHDNYYHTRLSMAPSSPIYSYSGFSSVTYSSNIFDNTRQPHYAFFSFSSLTCPDLPSSLTTVDALILDNVFNMTLLGLDGLDLDSDGRIEVVIEEKNENIKFNVSLRGNAWLGGTTMDYYMSIKNSNDFATVEIVGAYFADVRIEDVACIIQSVGWVLLQDMYCIRVTQWLRHHFVIQA